MDARILEAAIAGLLSTGKHWPVSFQMLSLPPYDHTPDSNLSRVIQLANRLSLGSYNEADDRTHELQQLLSIFSRVRLNHETLPENRYLPIAPLTLSRTAMFATDPAKESITELYEALWHGEKGNAAWTGLVQEAKTLRAGDTPFQQESYLEGLLNVLQRYATCVPSIYGQSVPDVSLYDHGRSVAALVVCLAERSAEEIDAWLNGGSQDKAVALLVGGDISGVQDFLYTLSSRRAAKTLRGRSFYLQLLTEAAARFVLRELRLPYTNIIYSGGGHFYLLAPVKDTSYLNDIQAKVTDKLLRHHGISSYLAMGWAPVPASGFELGQFSTYWREMHAGLTRAKQRRYTELGDQLYERVFAPVSHGGNREKTCAVCGEERADTTGENENAICGLCRSFERLGKDLAQAQFVVLGLCPPQAEVQGEADAVLHEFGLAVSFAKDVTDPVKFSTEPERVVLWALDDPANGKWPLVKGNAPTTTTRRYTVNRVPMVVDAAEADRLNRLLKVFDSNDDDYAHPGLPKTFSHLQEESAGIKRLGVLRMDVDNLGDIFGRGLMEKQNGEDRSLATLARVSALSFRMSLFFEGWVKRLCEQPDYANKIYPVYAGGDDLFLIGPWNLMPMLAKQIADDFAEYVGHNPDVHLSAGMALIHGKYPIYQAADDAKDELDKAKAPEIKNAFAFLGQAWRWGEFGAVVQMFERLKRLVESKTEGGLGGSRAVLQALRQFARDDGEKAEKASRPVWGAWMWRAAYQFVRWEEQAGKGSDLGKALSGIHDDLSQDDYQTLPRWGAAARWAQLIMRERDNNR